MFFSQASTVPKLCPAVAMISSFGEYSRHRHRAA
jgi:hypothetical protein